MKRCPKCSFLYLDSDQVCDLDQTPLVADEFGTETGVIEQSELKPEKVSPTSTVPKSKAKPKRKRKPKTLIAAIVAALIVGLALLLTYQKMRPTLQASQHPPISQAEASQASLVAKVARRALDEVTAKAEVAQQVSESPAAPDNNTSRTVDPSTSATAKTTSHTRSDSERVRVSSNPVSTGPVAESGRGPVTIRLADGSSLEADEVWKTKAGIWYRRKGIVTFIKPKRVRAMNH